MNYCGGGLDDWLPIIVEVDLMIGQELLFLPVYNV